MTLSDAEGHQTLLMVIPPETAPDVAERALTMASARAVFLTPDSCWQRLPERGAGLAGERGVGDEWRS
jgi:hypothetical protein